MIYTDINKSNTIILLNEHFYSNISNNINNINDTYVKIIKLNKNYNNNIIIYDNMDIYCYLDRINILFTQLLQSKIDIKKLYILYYMDKNKVNDSNINISNITNLYINSTGYILEEDLPSVDYTK